MIKCNNSFHYHHLQIAALSLQVETVPLAFSIGLSSKDGPMRTLVTLQQEECGSESDVCQQYLGMNK